MKVNSLIIASLLIFQTSTWSLAEKAYAPDVQIERAIELAKIYVAKKKIDVSRHFIGSVEYLFINDKHSWRVEWRLKAGDRPGGQIIVMVYQNETVDHGFGE